MNVRFKSTAAAMLVALGFLGTGSLLGQAHEPIATAPLSIAVHTPQGVEHIALAPRVARTGRGLQRHAAMPFFSFSRTLQ